MVFSKFAAPINIKINNSVTFSTTAGAYLNISTSNGDSFWNLGESVEINAKLPPINEIILDADVYATVIDTESDSIILMGYLQEAS